MRRQGQRFFSYFGNEWLLVLSLVLLGTLLRFAHFNTTMFWSNDISRDMLVSWQIVTLGHWPVVGHFNTGIQGFYQPYYYYFLGILAKFGGTPDFLYACFIAAHSASLIGIYLIAKNLFSKQAGYTALFLSAGAGSLINLSHFPTAAPWSWPLYILSLTLTSFWFTTQKKNYLWLAAVVSFFATQVHGSQLVFLVMLLVLIGRQKLPRPEFFAWLGVWFVLAVNQRDLIVSVLSRPSSSVPQLNWQPIVSTLSLFEQTTAMSTWFFYVFWILFGALWVWFLWRKKQLFKPLRTGWKFYLSYIVVFELLVGLFKTGALSHHQYYVIPVVFIIVPGLVLHMQPTLDATKNVLLRFLLLGLFGYSIMIHHFADLGAFGDFYQARDLYAELKQSDLPIQTATVLMTDNDPHRLSDASNSTQLWWFLATDLGRTDFNASAWSLGNYAQQLLVVCNVRSSVEYNVSCDAQAREIVAKTHRNFIQRSRVILAEKFEVSLYEE